MTAVKDTDGEPAPDPGEAEPPTTVGEPPLLLTQETAMIWQTIAARRISYDSMMWQTPALGLTAQAFLLTLALGGQTAPVARAAAAAVSLILAVMCLQLMAKHRVHERTDSVVLNGIERRLGFTDAVGVDPHAPKRDLSGPPLTWRHRAVGVGFSSFRLWIAGQAVFLLVAVAILLTVLLGGASLLTLR